MRVTDAIFIATQRQNSELIDQVVALNARIRELEAQRDQAADLIERYIIAGDEALATIGALKDEVLKRRYDEAVRAVDGTSEKRK